MQLSTSTDRWVAMPLPLGRYFHVKVFEKMLKSVSDFKGGFEAGKRGDESETRGSLNLVTLNTTHSYCPSLKIFAGMSL